MNEDSENLDILKDTLKTFKWQFLQISTLINFLKNTIIQKLPEITLIIENEISNKVKGVSSILLFANNFLNFKKANQGIEKMNEFSNIPLNNQEKCELVNFNIN